MASDQITRMDVEHGCKLSGEGGRDAFSVGMRNMENDACVVRWNMEKDACGGRRIGSRPGQVDTFGCKLFGGRARDVCWVTRNMEKYACVGRQSGSSPGQIDTLLDASFLGIGQGYVSVGMRNTESDASVGHQSGSRPGQVDTVGCKLSGEGTGMFFGRHVEHGK